MLAGVQRAVAKRAERLEEWIDERTIPEPNTGCFIWTGKVDRAGYGRKESGPKHKRVSTAITRVVYALHFGPVPREMEVCHKCDFPPCVNPAHLFLGTPKDNAADKVAKGRQPRKLTPEAVAAIRLDDRPHTTVAREYGVSETLISRIRRNEAWRR